MTTQRRRRRRLVKVAPHPLRQADPQGPPLLVRPQRLQQQVTEHNANSCCEQAEKHHRQDVADQRAPFASTPGRHGAAPFGAARRWDVLTPEADRQEPPSPPARTSTRTPDGSEIWARMRLRRRTQTGRRLTPPKAPARLRHGLRPDRLVLWSTQPVTQGQRSTTGSGRVSRVGRVVRGHRVFAGLLVVGAVLRLVHC